MTLKSFCNDLYDVSIIFNKDLLTSFGGGQHSVIKPKELHSSCFRPFATAFGQDIF